jgi:hypothetical protein
MYVSVFKGVVMLSQGSIHFRQELINLISYVNKNYLKKKKMYEKAPISYSSTNSISLKSPKHSGFI